MNDAEGPKVTRPPKLHGAEPADMDLAEKTLDIGKVACYHSARRPGANDGAAPQHNRLCGVLLPRLEVIVWRSTVASWTRN